MDKTMHNLGHFPNVPREPVRFPRLPEVKAQVRQLQTSSQTSQIGQVPTSKPVSINVPKPVTGLAVNVKVSGNNKIVTISFRQSPQDVFYQKANILLKSGIALPVHIASGTTSPIVVTIPRSAASGVILVQAEGNWGPHPLQNSPSHPVNLR
jgi:hypothetical protein